MQNGGPRQRQHKCDKRLKVQHKATPYTQEIDGSSVKNVENKKDGNGCFFYGNEKRISTLTYMFTLALHGFDTADLTVHRDCQKFRAHSKFLFVLHLCLLSFVYE